MGNIILRWTEQEEEAAKYDESTRKRSKWRFGCECCSGCEAPDGWSDEDTSETDFDSEDSEGGNAVQEEDRVHTVESTDEPFSWGSDGSVCGVCVEPAKPVP